VSILGLHDLCWGEIRNCVVFWVYWVSLHVFCVLPIIVLLNDAGLCGPD
jgi:hypothetical protein